MYSVKVKNDDNKNDLSENDFSNIMENISKITTVKIFSFHITGIKMTSVKLYNFAGIISKFQNL